MRCAMNIHVCIYNWFLNVAWYQIDDYNCTVNEVREQARHGEERARLCPSGERNNIYLSHAGKSLQIEDARANLNLLSSSSSAICTWACVFKAVRSYSWPNVCLLKCLYLFSWFSFLFNVIFVSFLFFNVYYIFSISVQVFIM